jgi:uncharacterized integral membrane protein
MKRKIDRAIEEFAEYYTLLVIVVALPVVLGFITSALWGLLLSFLAQAIIGILYLKGGNK